MSEFTPVVKWAGGKSWLLPVIEELYKKKHGRKRFVEVCGGGIALSLGLAPISALINDINPHLVNLYHWLKIGLVADYDIKHGTRRTLVRMENCRDVYLSNRKRFNDLILTQQWNTQEAALLFWYLNRTGFNGLCRFSKKGNYNVPFGKYARIDYGAFVEKFLHYQKVLSGWRFISRDFESVPLGGQDFVYIDPPYDTPFVAYAKQGFTWYDQVRLANWATKIQGPVVVSNAATERVIDLYRKHGFTIHLLDAPRRIACNGNRAKAQEMLAVRGV